MKANIPVVDAVTADKTAPLVPGTFSHVSISFYHSGQLQADYAIAKSDGKAHVLILGDNEFPGEVSRVEGMQKEFSTKCPDCAVTVQDTQVGNLGVKLGQLTQTLLRRSPDITMVLPTYDAQAIYVVPAIKAANFSNPVEVVGSDAVPSNLDWIRQGNVQIADVGEPEVWLGLGGARRSRPRHARASRRRRANSAASALQRTTSRACPTTRTSCSAAITSPNTANSGA